MSPRILSYGKRALASALLAVVAEADTADHFLAPGGALAGPLAQDLCAGEDADPLALAGTRRRYGGTTRVWVHPRVHPLVAVPVGVARSLDGRIDRVPHGSITFDTLREYVLGDVTVHATKIGMLATAAIVEAVTAAIDELDLPMVVVDPVLRSTSGRPLLDADGEPVGHAAIYVVSAPAPQPDIAQLTGLDGSFAIGASVPGVYVIGARSDTAGEGQTNVIVTASGEDVRALISLTARQ